MLKPHTREFMFVMISEYLLFISRLKRMVIDLLRAILGWFNLPALAREHMIIIKSRRVKRNEH